MPVDYASQMKISKAIAPAAAVTDNTAFVSSILDMQNFDSNIFSLLFGSVADTDVTFTVLVEDGDDSGLSDNAEVDDAYLIGIEAAGLRYDSDNKTYKVAYKGLKRYLRVTVTPASNSGNIFLSAEWIQMGARTLPQATQVV